MLDSRRRWQRRTIFDLLVLLTRASSITMFALARPRPLRRKNFLLESQTQGSHFADKLDQQLPNPPEHLTNNPLPNP